MGNPCRFHYAIALAASVWVAAPACAKTPKEPIVVSLAGKQADAANALAGECMARGWVVRNRTDYSMECAVVKGDPRPVATFSLTEQSDRTLIQATTSMIVFPGVFGESWKMAENVSAMLTEMGAQPVR